jgi:hypothetical protein
MTNTAPTQADAARVNPRSSAVSPTPQWATTFAQIGSTIGGYARVALLNGVCVSQDGVGNAQMPVAGAPAVAWTQARSAIWRVFRKPLPPRRFLC